MSDTSTRQRFDIVAAASRWLLVGGLVAGPSYVVVAGLHALLTPGFDFSRHTVDLLALADTGWIQQANFIVAGVLVVAAALGFMLALGGLRGGLVAFSVAVFGLSLIGCGLFQPAPMAGFPPGVMPPSGPFSGFTGFEHVMTAGFGFLFLAVAAVGFASWVHSYAPSRTQSFPFTMAAFALVVAVFLGAPTPADVILSSLAVLIGFAWLFSASFFAYRGVPHPNPARRGTESADASR